MTRLFASDLAAKANRSEAIRAVRKRFPLVLMYHVVRQLEAELERRDMIQANTTRNERAKTIASTALLIALCVGVRLMIGGMWFDPTAFLGGR